MVGSFYEFQSVCDLVSVLHIQPVLFCDLNAFLLCLRVIPL